MWVVMGDDDGTTLFVATVEDGQIPALDRLVVREAWLFSDSFHQDVAPDAPQYFDAPRSAAPPRAREPLFWKACGLVLVVGTLLSTQVPATKAAATPAPWRRRPKRASPKKAAPKKRKV